MEVEAGVTEQIDALVKQEVEGEIAKLCPTGLSDEIRQHRNELEGVQKQLHNS